MCSRDRRRPRRRPRRRVPSRSRRGGVQGRGGGSSAELGVSTNTHAGECDEQQQARWRRSSVQGRGGGSPQARLPGSAASSSPTPASSLGGTAHPARARRGLLPLVPVVGGGGGNLLRRMLRLCGRRPPRHRPTRWSSSRLCARGLADLLW